MKIFYLKEWINSLPEEWDNANVLICDLVRGEFEVPIDNMVAENNKKQVIFYYNPTGLEV